MGRIHFPEVTATRPVRLVVIVALLGAACHQVANAQTDGLLCVYPDNPRYFTDNTMIRFVKKCERDLPRQHPVGMTCQNKRGENAILFESSADWVLRNSVGGFRDDPPGMGGSKVVIVDTADLWGIGGDATWVWKSVTPGLNPIFMDTYDGGVLGVVRLDHDQPRRAVGQAIRSTLQMNLGRAVPQSLLCSTGYCLAGPGEAYLVFLPKGVRQRSTSLLAEDRTTSSGTTSPRARLLRPPTSWAGGGNRGRPLLTGRRCFFS